MLSIGKESNKIQIKKFDVTSMYQNASIIVLGKDECPTSVLEQYKNIQSCYVISRNMLSKQIYTNIFPNVTVHSHDDSNIFNDILKHQKEMMNTGKPEQTMIILDYRYCDDIVWKNEALREILFNGRHYNITYIMMIQIYTNIVPSLRSCFDYILMENTDNICEQRKLYNYYAGMFSTFDNFFEVYVHIIKNNYIMVLDRHNNSASQEISDKVFYL
jgi:hypothetical protein